MLRPCLIVYIMWLGVTDGFVATKMVKHVDVGRWCIPVLVPHGHKYVPCSETGKRDTIQPCDGDLVQLDDVSSEYEPICVAPNWKTCPVGETKVVEECSSGQCQKVCICSREKGFCGNNYLNCDPLPAPSNCLPEFVEQDCTCRLPTSVSAGGTTVNTKPTVQTPSSTTPNVLQTTKNNSAKAQIQTETNSSSGVAFSEVEGHQNEPISSSSSDSKKETGTNWTAIIPSITAVVVVLAILAFLCWRKKNRGDDNTDNSISIVNCFNFTRDQNINVGHGRDNEAETIHDDHAALNLQNVQYTRLNRDEQVIAQNPLAVYERDGAPIENGHVHMQPRHVGSNGTIQRLSQEDIPYDQSQNRLYSDIPNGRIDPDLHEVERRPLIAHSDAGFFPNNDTVPIVTARLSETVPLTLVRSDATISTNQQLSSENTIPTGQLFGPIKETEEMEVESSNDYAIADTQSATGSEVSKDLADGQVGITGNRRTEVEVTPPPRETAVVRPMVQSSEPASSENQPGEHSFSIGPLIPRPELPREVGNMEGLDLESLSSNASS